MSTDYFSSGGILLFTVADHFTSDGKGCVVFPGVPYPSATVPIIDRGAPITLRRPDGTEVQSTVRELEMVNRRPYVPFIPILLPSPLAKSDVPIGTEVWYFPTPDDTYSSEPNA